MTLPGAAPLPASAFALDPALTYLNHAAVGVLPIATRDALVEAVTAHARSGVLGTWPVERELPRFRERVASFIGAQADEIAFLRSTSDGANVVARGLDWESGDEIVLPDNEFGANALAWLALREFGVGIRFVETARGRLTPEQLARAIGPKTRLVTVSWVSFADGYRHDLCSLASVAHERGALFCVDAIQGLGAFPLDVRRCGIDALYAGGAKWLMGLQGVSLLYVGSELRERLKVRWHGWKALANIWDFLDYEQPLAADSSRYEAGTQNFLGALSLERSLGVLQAAGVEQIAAHVLQLTDRLARGLAEIGATVKSPRGPEVSSGILLFDLPGRDPVELGAALQRAGFVTTYRRNGIRVSPHGYNTVQEIDAFVEAVAASRSPAVRS